MLTAPLAFSMLAGYLRLYPFHGRLILFLTPCLLILVAEGAGFVAETIGGRAIRVVLVGFLVVVPALGMLFYVIEPPRPRWSHPHGDRRPLSTTADVLP